jgi:hypothetical protein
VVDPFWYFRDIEIAGLNAVKPRFARFVRQIVCLEMPDPGDSSRRKFELAVQEPFRPFALLVWGARVETQVRNILVDGVSQLIGSLPGFMFEADIPFDEFERLLTDTSSHGYRSLTPQSFERVGHIFELALPTIATGDPLVLELEGPIEHAVFLGHMLRPKPLSMPPPSPPSSKRESFA